MYSRTHLYELVVDDETVTGSPGVRAVAGVNNITVGEILGGVPSDFQAPPTGRGFPFGRAVIDVRIARTDGVLVQFSSKMVEFVAGGTVIQFNAMSVPGTPGAPLGISF
jgi:hypothetical protein